MWELHPRPMATINHKNCETCTPAHLFNLGCKFACSFLATTAWHSFYRLGITLYQAWGGILGIFEQVKHFCEWFLVLLWKTALFTVTWQTEIGYCLKVESIWSVNNLFPSTSFCCKEKEKKEAKLLWGRSWRVKKILYNFREYPKSFKTSKDVLLLVYG